MANMRELLEVTGAFKNLDELFGNDPHKELLDKLMEELIEAMDKVYTPEEIDEFVEFYHSPLGQKMLSKQKVAMEVTTNVVSRFYGQNL